MLMIRLKRIGRRNDPSFRIVVGEKIYSPKSGKHFAYLGSYNPHTKVTIVDEVAVKEWMAKGAQVSDTLTNLFITKGILSGKKINVLPKKVLAKVEEPAAPAAAPVAEAAPEVAAEPVAEAPAEEPAPEVLAEAAPEPAAEEAPAA